ncbi:MAG: hypothetical protein GY714_20095 [Desulfobacterales bacterium]|nr:hypothetical protein [Desulfobacterales bacterium]
MEELKVIQNDVIKQAEAEVQEEVTKKAKEKLKVKLREKIQAEHVLANINREIDEIKLSIGHDLGQA